GGAAPALGVAPRIEGGGVKSQQPGDEEESSPRPPGGGTATRGEQGVSNQDALAKTPQALAEDPGPHQGEGLLATQLSEDGGAHEDPLIAVVVPRETVTDAVYAGAHTQADRRFGEQVLERAAHHTRAGQGVIDQVKRASRGLGVRVEKEQNISGRRTGPGVHQRGASGAARPQESRAPGHRSVSARLITPGRDDDFGTFNTSDSRQGIDGPLQRCRVAARGNDDRDPTLRPGWHDSSLYETRAHGPEIRCQDSVAEPTASVSVSKTPTRRREANMMDGGRSA